MTAAGFDTLSDTADALYSLRPCSLTLVVILTTSILLSLSKRTYSEQAATTPQGSCANANTSFDQYERLARVTRTAIA